MIREFFLNFYDEIRVQIRINAPRWIGPLYYRNLYPLLKERIGKSKPEEPIDLIIQIGFPFEKSADRDVSRNGAFIGKEYCRIRYQKKTIKSEVEILNNEKSTILVKIKVNLWGKMLFPLDLLNALIHFVAFQKGICLIHAGSICKRGKGVLLFGSENIGKTFFIIEALGRNYDLIDDDFTFIHGKSICNYSPFLVLKFHHRKMIPFLNWKDRVNLFVKEAISIVTFRYINLLTAIHSDRFLKKGRREKVDLFKIFYLRKGDLMKIGEVSEKEKLVQSIVLETKIAYPFLVKLSGACSDPNVCPVVSMHWRRLEEKLTKYLEDVICEEVQVPKRLTEEEIEEVFGGIEHAV
jgi:hypothetical protein